MTPHYHVIIIGGRPAGSTLAARLGRRNLRVLLLERDSLPSLPAASSPIVYSPVMHLLDEIGAVEGDYARDTPRIPRVIIHAHTHSTPIRLPKAHNRDYAYAIDRARFDAALWNNAARYPTVEARQNYNVTDLLWDGDRVTGIVGKPKGGAEERLTADLVVGADGRFSLVARKVNAPEYDVHDNHPTSLYYAYWKGVRPYDDLGPAAVAYEGGYGYGFLVMDSADGSTAITFEGQSALLDPPPGQIETFYRDLLNSHPHIRARVAAAEPITPVHGMRRIRNLYRQSGGSGWALVGDAYHQHDPLDGQGIFNALYSAKALSWAVLYWQRGEKTWPEALAWYDETVRIKTYGMFHATLFNVRQNIYNELRLPAAPVNLARWMAEDPALHDLLGKMLTRQLPAEVLQLYAGQVLLASLVRGPLRDLRRLFDSLPTP